MAPPTDDSIREVSATWFANPPLRYRPSATVRIGETPPEVIPTVLQPVVEEEFGSLLMFPVGPPPAAGVEPTRDPTLQRLARAVDPTQIATWLAEAGERPKPRPDAAEYLSDEYFARYGAAVDFAASHGMSAVLYDELGYPSGFAGGGRISPQHFRKLLVRTCFPSVPERVHQPPGALLAAVALNAHTGERLGVTSQVAAEAALPPLHGPAWSLQMFSLVTSSPQGGLQDYHAVVDYFDPVAVEQFIAITYDSYARHLGEHLGSTITRTFFDDVGIYPAERTWAASIAERFRARTGRDPEIYYPALWQDIGQETAAARVAFFNARAELLGEGFPALATEWAHRHGMQTSGHCPGQYEIQPTDMCGDPFAFYRAQDIPMIDVIYTYGFGRAGFKLTSSAADARDKPIVMAEQFTTRGSEMGYRRSMDSFIRGVNHLIARTGNEIGPPPSFAQWAGRVSMLLQGGRRVADIAILYPVASLQAYYAFDAPENQEGPVGRYAPPTADYLAVGDWLTCDLHRDFTFIHPHDLATGHLKVTDGLLVLDNPTNRQEFRAVILPGADVISAEALAVVRAFQESGGAVIGTTLLPTRSAEFGRDDEVQSLVREIFATAQYLPDATPETLRAALDRAVPDADVSFAGSPAPHSGNGRLAYIHKVKASRDIYFIANSSDDHLTCTVSVRGSLTLHTWDPHTGQVCSDEAERRSTALGPRTEVSLSLPPVSSVVLVGDAAPDLV